MHRNFAQLLERRTDEEGHPTKTSREQIEVEKSIQKIFFNASLCTDLGNGPKLLRNEHINFLKGSLSFLPGSYECLDASRSWITYWSLHGLSLLDVDISSLSPERIIDFLNRCQSPEGGFGGGPGQRPHLAPTYAAVNSLCIIGTEKSYEIINRAKLYSFLKSLRSSDGSFSMENSGETDIRGVYCALAVATLTNIATEELFDKTADWAARCQTYEGGFSGTPGMEAHGGYTFCGLAVLCILNKVHLCNLDALLRWVANRQMKFEGGFQGRTNKLVDGCYSFWQGGIFPLLHCLVEKGKMDKSVSYMFDQDALQEYILLCCQNAAGGLVDKPGKSRDAYHSCYILSGLSVAQHFGQAPISILGSAENRLKLTHPIFNMCPEKCEQATEYFGKLDAVGM